ncbi:hypothetical protein [Chryseobacterium turcicum]|uniref:Uncharacterized protein n=1 Tax=Chryseobacterium turcicum TaxID=2898076 RepID=A0A9Q3YVJ8_9FLAO|nr:hypothetical protein [Chryseobacterium turcicum]MCD1116968.1 hypothetical protein [Chryseobacterium turcicum]
MKLTESEIPKEYKLTEENQCKSIQASILFNNPKMYEMIFGKIKSQEIQNFESSKDSGSILYLEFANKFESESFVKSLLWGTSNKPTNKNPEEIYFKNNILIIWSFNKESELKKLSKTKVEAGKK